MGLNLMGKIFDYLSGGNAKVAANSLVEYHNKANGNYFNTYSLKFIYLYQNLQMTPSLFNNTGFLAYFDHNEIKNYTDLVAIELNSLAAPSGTPITFTIFDFQKEIEGLLLKKKIPPQLVSGDNRSLTKNFQESSEFANLISMLNLG